MTVATDGGTPPLLSVCVVVCRCTNLRMSLCMNPKGIQIMTRVIMMMITIMIIMTKIAVTTIIMITTCLSSGQAKGKSSV